MRGSLWEGREYAARAAAVHKMRSYSGQGPERRKAQKDERRHRTWTRARNQAGGIHAQRPQYPAHTVRGGRHR
jgi:hypothetical protein